MTPFVYNEDQKKNAFAQHSALTELTFLQSTQIVLSIPKYN